MTRLMYRHCFGLFMGCLLMLTCRVTAQQDLPYTEEITVISPYKPTITEAHKININPRIELTDLQIPEMTYSIEKHPANVTFNPQPIKPAAIVGEPITRLYRNYLRAGVGNYKTPYLEFFAGSLRSDKSALGVHLKHLSSGEMKDHPSSSQSFNAAEIWGNRFLKKRTLSGNLYYNRRMVHYYGYNDSLAESYDVSRDQLKQVYNLIGVKGALKASDNPGKLNDTFHLGYYYLFDHQKSQEHHANLDIILDKDVALIDATDRENITLETSVEFYHNNDTLTSSTCAIISLKPVFQVTFNEYGFKAGLDASIGIDSSSSAYVYPVAEVNITIIEDALKAYLGITGGLERNSFKALSDANPFIVSTPSMEFTSTKYDLYGGINARIGRFFDWIIHLSGAGFSQMPFFVTDTSSPRNKDLENQFTMVYDNGKQIHGRTECTFRKNEQLGLTFRANYYMYNLDNETEAWHKPSFDLTVSGKYNIQDKFLIDAAVIYTGPSYAKTWSGGQEKALTLDGYFDVNLGLEYRYNKNLSAFLQVNNLTNQSYYRWYNYVSHRLNVLIGITFSF